MAEVDALNRRRRATMIVTLASGRSGAAGRD